MGRQSGDLSGLLRRVEKCRIVGHFHTKRIVYISRLLLEPAKVTAVIKEARGKRMGNQLIWNERYNIGVEVIDREHKKLFGILNKLVDLRQQEEKSHWVCQEAVKFFKEHALQHFADEEEYMASIGYVGLETHRHIHIDFRERTLPALEKELEQSNYSENSINHFIGVCAGWLVGHTLIEDHMIVNGDSVRQWEQLLPEEEQAVMGQTISGLIHSMFQLDSHLISDCYNGEKFGDEICCRLIYSTSKDKKREFFLIFEKQLIINTIGSVMDMKSEAVTIMLTNVAKYIARQLVRRIMQHFSSSEDYDLKEEQLLTYDQFHRIFKRQSPQFSLLFDTGKGYFVYCATAADTLQSQEGISTITRNAMAEVDKYLQNNKEEKTVTGQKKKLLVVDDSDFMLRALRDLLGSDYEVSTAGSGLSAIRDITLHRPDLILLDYEMPVCNGSQVLEMIRSEKEFMDIPVIFLTCRVDRESVQKVISLKPEGYLSKSLPPETIKQKIDHFFDQQIR